MHKYLQAIGYGNITSKKQLNEFLRRAEETYTHHELVEIESELDFCEYQRECGAGIGVSICGDMDINENFQRQYYYPYFIGCGPTSYADVVVERRMGEEAYAGICEDVKVGISLIFYLQNAVELIKEKQLSGKKVKYGFRFYFKLFCFFLFSFIYKINYGFYGNLILFFIFI